MTPLPLIIIRLQRKKQVKDLTKKQPFKVNVALNILVGMRGRGSFSNTAMYK